VGAYPFTTLEPSLGVVETGYDAIVVADIPGLIAGAHEGAGLGISFLRHIERTELLVHVVDASSSDPLSDIRIVRDELSAFGHGLADKPWLVALNKIDLPGAAERADILARDLRKQRADAYPICATSGEGTGQLVAALFERMPALRERRRGQEEHVILRPKPAQRFEVRACGGGYEVAGFAAVRVLMKLGTEGDEARSEAERRLRRMGVVKALERAGVREGDMVRIGEAQFAWPL
jgi:GTP-binding protein